MATQPLTVQNINFSLDGDSSWAVKFPVMDITNAPINVTTGWTVKKFWYAPSDSDFNGYNNPIDLSTVGSFTWGNGFVTWNVPNNCGINPLMLNNQYILELSNDGGTTGCVCAAGQWSWLIYNYLVPG